jgi:hypothetical protein
MCVFRHPWHVWPNRVRWIRGSSINQICVTEIPCAHLIEEFVHLAGILDAHSRSVVGWTIEFTSASGSGDASAESGYFMGS